MNQLRSIITIRFVSALLAGLSMAGLAVAHGGFEHVMGTVAKLDAQVLTVKTAKGNVDVKLDAKTQITKGDKKAALSDLTVGLRVVVDLPENVKAPVAHSVKIGVAEAVDTKAANRR
jgi:hypothetical protein